MRLTWLLALVLLQPLSSLACRSASVGGEGPPVVPASQTVEPRTAVPQTAEYVPEGTLVRGRLNQELSTESNAPGDRFTITVLDDVTAANGEVAVPAGSVITGTVTTLDPSTHVGEQASVHLHFETITMSERVYPVAARIVDADVKQARRGSGIATGAGAGAVGGVALGAILGGGSGALKGGLIGAAGGTLVSLGTGDVEAKLPAGSVMTLRLMSQVDKR